MLLQQTDLPVVPIVQAGYVLLGLCVLAAISVLAWDSRAFMGHPITERDRHHRAYVGSLMRGVWQLASAVVVAVTAGVSFVVVAWSMA